VKVYAAIMNNRVAELEDKSNSTPENAWVSLIDPNEFQAILPLPYFHVGSENVWVEPKCDILRQSFIVSLKSGLPSMGVMLSRTSLSQTYKSLALVNTPVSPFPIKNDLPNTKPLLLMVENCNNLTEPEINLLQHSSFLWKGPKFSFFKLQVDRLDSIAKEGETRFKNAMAMVYEGRSDSTQLHYFDGFEHLTNESSFHGSGTFSGKSKNCF